jgi:hypothetical protein
MYDYAIGLLIAAMFSLFIIGLVLILKINKANKQLTDIHRLMFLPQTTTQKPPSGVTLRKSNPTKKKPKFFTDEQMWEKVENDKRRDNGNRYNDY